MKFVLLSGPGLSAGGNIISSRPWAGGNNISTRLAKFGRIFKKSVKTQNTFFSLGGWKYYFHPASEIWPNFQKIRENAEHFYSTFYWISHPLGPGLYYKLLGI